MKRVNVTDAQYEALKTICNKFYITHEELAGRRIPLEKEYNNVGERTFRLSEVLEYVPTSTGNIKTKKWIGRKFYDNFLDKFERFSVLDNKTDEDVKLLEDYQRLRRSIEKENVEFGDTKYPNLVKEFSEKSFYIYERRQGGISRRILHFSKVVNDRMEISIEVEKRSDLTLKGFAFVDSLGDYIVMETKISHEKNALPTPYMIRVNKEVDVISLCCGHKMVKKNEGGNVLSKTVILEKISNPKAASVEYFRLDNNENNVEEQVGKEIYKYFASKLLNRMSSPHQSIISTKEDLIEWQADNKKNPSKETKQPIKGDYKIYYKGDAASNKITEDKLSIQDHDEAGFMATYYHYLDVDGVQTFTGRVVYSISSRALFISMEDQDTNRELNDVDTVFLILNLPPKAGRITMLTGILTGIKDDQAGSIGLGIMAYKPTIEETSSTNVTLTVSDAKQLISGTDSDNEQTLVDQCKNVFLQLFKDRSVVLPPTQSINTIEHLQKCLDDEKKLQNRYDMDNG